MLNNGWLAHQGYTVMPTKINLVCYMYTATCCGGRPGGKRNLFPRPSMSPVFDDLQYAKVL